MEAFLFYLLKSSGILFLFWCCYQLFLRKETFFNLNRWFLLLGMAATLFVPLLRFNKTVWVENTSELEITAMLNQAYSPMTSDTLSWPDILVIVYLFGVSVVMTKLVFQLFSLWRLIRQGNAHLENGMLKIETDRNIPPFSFLNYIIYNENIHSPSELTAILKHEESHIKQNHSVDILWAHLLIAFQWFNPFAWWYMNLIRQNHEFIADRDALRAIEDKKEYQYLLLKNNSEKSTFSFANPFFNSLIKKRIIMLNKTASTQRNLWKYSIIALPLIAFVMTFQTRTIAQLKEPETVDSLISNGETYSIGKNTSDKEIEAIELAIEENGGQFTYSVERNSKGEITALELEIISNGNGTGRFKSEVLFERCYFGTLPDGGIFVADNQKSFEQLKIRETNNDEKYHDSTMTIGKITGIALETNGKKPLYVLDGKEVPYDTFDNLSPESIQSVTVLKGKQAIPIFGDKAKDGVVIITKKKWNVSAGLMPKNPTSTSLFEQAAQINADKDPLDLVNALILVEGEKITKTAFQSIPAQNIESISVLKDPASLEKHNAVGKKGIIKVTLHNPDLIQSQKSGPNPMVIIDGVESSMATVKTMDPDKIASMNVLKGESAIEKYGEKAKDGAVIITKKKWNVSGGLMPQNPTSTALYNQASGKNFTGDRVKLENPLILVDGKETTQEDFERIPAGNIESISILNDESATQKYGAKGEHGVWEVTLRNGDMPKTQKEP